MSSCKIFLSRVCAAVFFGITTVSAIFVVIAFVHFNRAYKSTLGTLDRFTMSPIVEYEVHPTTAPLPSGLSHYPTRNWPGSSDGPCVCPSGARWDGKSKTSDWGICSTNQTRAGCRTGNGLSGMDLSIWRESFFGMRRAGPGAVYRNDNGSWVERPRQHNGTVCPDGWRVCGGFYNDTCMPYSWEGVDVPCPVQSALITASPPIEPGLGQTVTTLPGAPSLALVISRGVRGVQVLVDAVTSFGKPCIGDPGGQGWYSGSTGGSTRHEGNHACGQEECDPCKGVNSDENNEGSTSLEAKKTGLSPIPHQLFPCTLYDMLEQAQELGFASIVSWKTHGRSFAVYNRTLFESQVMPK